MSRAGGHEYHRQSVCLHDLLGQETTKMDEMSVAGVHDAMELTLVFEDKVTHTCC
jgi:hypothetical protein